MRPGQKSRLLVFPHRGTFILTDEISSSLLESIIDNICLLLKSKSREVVQSALGFTKVLLSAYPVTVLAAYLKALVNISSEFHYANTIERLHHERNKQ